MKIPTGAQKFSCPDQATAIALNPNRLIKVLHALFLIFMVLASATSIGQTTYTWNSSTAVWTTTTAWTPTRTSPATNDILVFSSNTTVTPTSVPTQTIGKLQVSGASTIVNLQAGAAANVLSIGGGANALSVDAGCQLNISGANSLQLSILSGSGGSITGNMTFTNAAHTIISANASSLAFNSPSVFTAGTGFTGNAFGSGTNNSVIFASGSTYRAQAGANPFQKTAPNSVVVFQTGSLYKHQVANTPALSGRSYANFEYDVNSSQAGTGTGVFVCDNLTVSQGIFGLNVTGAPGHAVRGNISVASGAALNFNPASAATMNFTGSASQTITNAGTLTFSANESVVIANTGTPASVTFNQAQTISGSTTVNNGSILAIGGGTLTLAGTPAINGAFQVNAGGFASGGTWSYGTGATLVYNTTSNFNENGSAFWPAASGPTNVTVQNTGNLTLNVARTVSGVFQTTAGLVNANNLTANGTLQVNVGGFLTGTPIYGGASTLVYNTTSYSTTDNEFPPSGVKNVIVTAPSGTNTVTLNNDKTITGSFSIGANTVNGGKSIAAATITISSGSLVAGNITATSAFTCSGAASISLTGNWAVTGFSRATSTVNFAGNGSYANATSFYNLTNSAGTRNISADIDIENTLLVSGGQMGVTGGTGRTLNMSGAATTININGGSIFGTDAGIGNDLSLIVAGAQATLAGSATVVNDDEKKFFNVTVNTASKLVLARGILCKYGAFTVNGTLQINTNGYVNTSGLYGTDAKAASYNAATGSLIYNTGAGFNSGGEWPGSNSPVNVSVIAAGTNVIMAGSRTVSNTLALTNGTITTSANTLIVSNAALAAVTNSNGYVIGNLQRAIAAVINSYTFAVGTASGYAPASINFTAAGTGGNITVATLNGASANYPSPLSATKRLSRYWSVSNSGVSGFTANVTFAYLAGDLAGGATQSSIKGYKFDAPSTFSYPPTATGTLSFTESGITAFSEFGAGECGTIPVAAITGTTTVCVGATTQLADITPSGVWSSDAPSTASVNGTGLVSGNNAGSTTIRYTVTDISSGCIGEATATVTVNPNFTVNAGAGANGSISPNGITTLCQGQNQMYTISPVNACYVIADVLVDGVSVGAVSTYTFSSIAANHTISASFVQLTYTITVNPGANGSISPATAVVNCGSNNPYTITPDACYHIVDVTLDGVSQGAVGSLNINAVSANHTIAASFAINTYTITASAGINGSISSPGATVVNCGSNNPYTFTPAACYHVADVIVDGSSQGPLNNYTFSNTTASHTISVSFAINATLSAPVVNGIVNVCPYEGTGTQLTYTVTPDPAATGYFWVIPPTVTQVSGQGTGTLVITINNGFTAGANKQLRVTALSACSNSTQSIFYLLSQAPVTPSPIIGNTNVCPIIGTVNTFTYTIPPVPSATSYIWAGQAGTTNIVHPNGAGPNDTIVTVSFTSGFTSSAITARASNGCGTSNARSINVVKANPSAPGLISGPTNVCEYILPNGGTAVYRILTVSDAILYNWNVSPVSAIVTHPNGAGPMDTVITVQFQPGFTTGTISVTASNGCGTGIVRTLSLNKLLPATPSVMDIIPLQPCPNRIYSYTLTTVPPNSTSLQWTVPVAQGAILLTQTANSITVSYPSTAINSAVTVQSFNNCGSSVVRSTIVKLPACPPEDRHIVGKVGTAPETQMLPTAEMDIRVSPNPAVSDFSVQVVSPRKEMISVRILDMQGREYRRFSLLPGQPLSTGSGLKAGVYMIEARQGTVIKASRLIKF